MKYCTVCKARYDDSVSFCSVDGEVLEDDPTTIVDTVLDGQYHIESLLGKGGMGAVFRARHILLGDRVAIKVLPPEMRTNAEWLRRFRREGQAARRFRHPNAVTVYDLRTASDGMIYMVMEYVEGHTLDAELKARGHFTPAEAVSVLEPIMSVLNAAHAMGVVHRDLKPENIMIGKASAGGELNVKLLDLGIAKLREVAGIEAGKSTALTVAGQMLGTPYYMSPEQWGELPKDGNEEIDGRADIYSLALVFYEMIAGRRPYKAMTLLELRKEHVSVTPARLDEVVPGVSKAFSDVIARAMAKDRSDRPATTGELATELKAALAGGGNGAGGFVSAVKEGVSQTLSETMAIDGVRDTKTDVDAPTIITMDASAPQTRPPVDGKGLIDSRTMTAATTQAIPKAVLGSTWVTAPEPASVITHPPVVVPPAPTRKSKAPLVIVGVLLVLILGGSVGGYLIWNSLRTKTPPQPATNSNANPPSASKEVARYWLEVSPPTQKAQSSVVVPEIPIASGQLFKFHFVPSQDGYLYIVGPGEHNQLYCFLSEKPDLKATGWLNNAVKQGVNISFPAGSRPNGDERWLGLDTKPGTETYTLIFSPTPLDTPRFLKDAKPLDQLTAAEEQELSAFIEKYKNGSVFEYKKDDPSAPFVSVKSGGSTPTDNPLVLAVRIEHK
jgi:serine/threonine-protein kinase